MSTKKILAWHWLSAPNTYAHGLKWSNRVVTRGSIRLCDRGFHASIKPIDSLKYAPGNIICRVECSGRMEQEYDKIVCSIRKVLWQADATESLDRFARRCASDVLHLWEAPDIVKKYLETGDKKLATKAAEAAWDASQAAWAAGASRASRASRAAWAAGAASQAAGAAAWAASQAAEAAAWAASQAAEAAWAVAGAAEEKYNKWLEEELMALEPK